MNIRKKTYFFLLRVIRGIQVEHYYDLYWREDQNGIPPHTTEKYLEQLLTHCQKNVPYYANLMNDLGDSYHDDPIGYLQRLPVLTKAIIKENFKDLQSTDIAKRKWFYMTSGGSTGEPGKVIQDYDFSAKAGALQLFFSRLVGRETGECEVYLWGSEREITAGSENWKVRLSNKLTNSTYFNAFRMSPETMHGIVKSLNAKKPKLIVTYADTINDLAKFIEDEKLEVVPQKAIITSADMLFPFMREKIERVFQCKVFNRYGSREIGNIACERPGYEGLWVAPWGNYLEILDGQGNRVPDGAEGEIIVTSLMNYAMPMLRYRIDDRGTLIPQNLKNPNKSDQFIQSISGRSGCLFKAQNGWVVNPGFLMGLFYYKNWLKRCQIIQKSYSHILFKIVLTDESPQQAELDEVTAKTRLVFGDDCQVEFDFVDDIPASGSGKHRWVINEISEESNNSLHFNVVEQEIEG